MLLFGSARREWGGTNKRQNSANIKENKQGAWVWFSVISMREIQPKTIKTHICKYTYINLHNES